MNVFNLLCLVSPQISIVELEKSQRQQELLQLKSSYSPCEVSPYRKSLPGTEPRPTLDTDTPKLTPQAALNGLSPELSINGTASPGYDRGVGSTGKNELLARYLPISPDHEIVPPTPDPRTRQLGQPQPDYTRYSPAKIALRRHLNQDSAANQFRALGNLHR